MKRNRFANINLYWCIMSTISILNLLQKNTFWFYLHWTWLVQGIFLTLVERWIERSPQQISSFKLIRDLLFFKSLNMKAFRLKFLGALEAWSVELQRFGFVKVYGGFFSLIPIELQRTYLNVLRVFLRQNFSRTLTSWKLGVENKKGCPLFIVILEDKLHFELIYLKVCSRLLIGPNSS